MKYKIMVINGPNLNLLGAREQEIYGTATLEEINQELEVIARNKGVEIEFYQSNHEGELIDKIHSARGQAHYLIINGGAYTHYSIALHDALKAVSIPFIEVHMSNLEAREPFRHNSLLSPIATGKICGLGRLSYKMALMAACETLLGEGENSL
ncbi:MAG: type II 3-dehydroquinate dehydratase [Syntrophomonadaceae bacterium]|nr:type II 3-dehydroquinate dehydratase [Syntrophomonadaceae bacterium]